MHPPRKKRSRKLCRIQSRSRTQRPKARASGGTTSGSSRCTSAGVAPCRIYWCGTAFGTIWTSCCRHLGTTWDRRTSTGASWWPFRSTSTTFSVITRASAKKVRCTHYEYDGQRMRDKIYSSSFYSQQLLVDKGTSLHCYYVNMCRTGITCIFTCSMHFCLACIAKSEDIGAAFSGDGGVNIKNLT